MEGFKNQIIDDIQKNKKVFIVFIIQILKSVALLYLNFIIYSTEKN